MDLGTACGREKPINDDCVASTDSCGVSTLLLKIEIASDTMKSIMKGEKSLEITINDENDKRNNARKRVPFSMVSCDTGNMNINLNNCKVILYSNCMNNVNSVGQLFGDANANGGAGSGGHGGDSISRGGNGGAAGAGGDSSATGGTQHNPGGVNHGNIHITFGAQSQRQESSDVSGTNPDTMNVEKGKVNGVPPRRPFVGSGTTYHEYGQNGNYIQYAQYAQYGARAYGPARHRFNPYIDDSLLHFSNGSSMQSMYAANSNDDQYLNIPQLGHQNRKNLKFDSKFEKMLEEMRIAGYQVTITKKKENCDNKNNNNNNNDNNMKSNQKQQPKGESDASDTNM